jgi:antimicrobial peptide system SdpB family protein
MKRFVDWITTEHWLIGASLMRVSLGLWAVFFYLLHWPYRSYLWGPSGVLPFEKFLEISDAPSVFALSKSGFYFEAVYIAAIVLAVLVVVGFLPRLTILLHWLMIWSFQERNYLLGDGGDNIMRIVLLFLVLANTGAYFSVHASGDKNRDSVLQPARAIAHNLGILLIIAQLSLLYMSTGLYKVMGELWQNGTALYYILRVNEFSWPGVAEFIYRNPYLVVGLTYATVLFEVTFAPSLLNRWTRYLMIAAGFFFHFGIALFMGLVTFGWSMLSIYPLLLTDREYLASSNWLRQKASLTVFYDGWCHLCTRSIMALNTLDLFSLVRYRSSRDQDISVTYGVDTERAERRIQGVRPNGRWNEGMDTMVAISLRSPLLWPLLPLLLLGRLLFGQRAYDAIASRRLIVIPGGCPEHCALGGKGRNDCAR